MKKKILLSVLSVSVMMLWNANGAHAQGMAINTTGSTANASAMLDVSSTTQGMLVPRMTSAQRTAISSPATGLLVYQTDATAGFYFYDGSTWTSLSGGGGSPTGSAGGDLTGTYPNPTLTTSGVTSGTYGSATQVPAYTVNSKGRITAASNVTITGTTPGGSAGGDLSGTYPNPTVANSSITSSKILDGTITNSDVSTTAAIAYSKLNLTGSVSLTDHSATGTASSSTFLRGDNTWATPAGGTPSGAAGGDLSGTYPNPTLASSGVTAGTYGSATQSPSITVDSKGRITAVSNNTISGGSSSVSLQVLATQTNTLSCPTLSTTTIPFNSVSTSPTAGTFVGGVFTANTAGVYLVTLSAAGQTAINPVLNALILHGSTIVAVDGGLYTSNFPSSSITRTSTSAVVNMAVGETITCQVYNSNNATAASISTDGTTRVTIVKLN